MEACSRAFNGGFDLAAEWMGWENVFHCEWNEFGQRVLKHYWPNAISYEDITKTDFTIHRGRIDVLTGGFPCQPYSMAGKRLGKEDERHLWPQMLRAIRECQPTWVVGENVRGLVNWNGGMVFDEVQADLESEGYEVIPFILPACGKDAPHRRERVWFVAHSGSTGTRGERGKACNQNGGTRKDWGESIRQTHGQACTSGAHTTSSDGTTPNPDGNGQHKRHSHDEVNASEGWEYAQRDFEQGDGHGVAADANGSRRQEQHLTPKSSNKKQSPRVAMHTNSTSKQGQHFGQTRQGKFDGPNSGDGVNDWQNFPTQSPICGGNDGLPTELDGITFSKWRNESIKAYGNAVVPQVVYEIFKAIDGCNFFTPDSY